MQAAQAFIVYHYILISGFVFACVSVVFLSIGALGFYHLFKFNEYIIHDHIVWILGVFLAVLAYCLLDEALGTEEQPDQTPNVDFVPTTEQLRLNYSDRTAL